MLSNGDKQEDASNAMENIFWKRPNNQQHHPSWRAKPAQSSQQLEALCQRQRPFRFSGSGSKAPLRKYIYKIPLSHRMEIVSQKMLHVEQRINLFTPPTCVWILDLWMSSSGFLKHINLSKVYLCIIFISNLGLFAFLDSSQYLGAKVYQWDNWYFLPWSDAHFSPDKR